MAIRQGVLPAVGLPILDMEFAVGRALRRNMGHALAGTRGDEVALIRLVP